MAEVWKQRFEAIQQEQIAAKRAMEEKEAAYKAHVDERIKAVEVILPAFNTFRELLCASTENCAAAALSNSVPNYVAWSFLTPVGANVYATRIR